MNCILAFILNPFFKLKTYFQLSKYNILQPYILIPAGQVASYISQVEFAYLVLCSDRLNETKKIKERIVLM